MTDDDAREEKVATLLAAAKYWRATLIPNTSTGLAHPTRLLVEAIGLFDDE